MLARPFQCFSILLLLLAVFVASSAQVPIGWQLYTFRNQLPKDVPGMLQRIHGMGIRYLKGCGTYDLTKKAFKNLLNINDLQLVSYGAGYSDLQTKLEDVAANAAFFGATFVVCSWVPHKGDVFTLEEAQLAVSLFNKSGQFLREKGLTFVYHAHGYEFQPYGNGTFFDYMVENLDPADANIEMDVFWFKNSGQDPAAWLTRYPARFRLLHLKDRLKDSPDNVYAKADVESNVVLGSGDVDIAAVMKAATKAWMSDVLMEDESSRSEAKVPRSLAYLKNLH